MNIIKANIDIGITAFNNSISLTFDRYSDEYPENHSKVIHTHGSQAKVKFEMDP